MLFVQVALPLPFNPVYTYRVPDDLQERVAVGMRLLVPLGSRLQTGYVLKLSEDTDYPADRVRPVADLLDPKPLLTGEVIELCRRVADYYQASLGETLRAALPPGINFTSRSLFRAQPLDLKQDLSQLSPVRQRILGLLQTRGECSAKTVAREVRQRHVNRDLHYLLQKGLISSREEVAGKTLAQAMEKWVLLSEEHGPSQYTDHLNQIGKRRKAQAAILEFMLREKEILRQNLLLRFRAQPLNKLVQEGWLQIQERPKYSESRSAISSEKNRTRAPLTSAQQEALAKINAAQKFQPILLYGVTGSGKTRVYLEAADQVLKQGRTVLILVPEISLTPQIVSRFQGFFGDAVIVLHSRLTDRQRFDAWLGIHERRYTVVVGVRSAVFAPLENLGLIIVDEEQETSYKQYDPAPRYHGRDVAILRAWQDDIPVLLGSATPSLEIWQQTVTNRYQRLVLPERINQQPLPEVELIDMKKAQQKIQGETVRIFSDPFVQGLIETIKQGNQAIILQNRRGFNTYQLCLSCGTAESCPHCDVTLTYHKYSGQMRCHYCGYSRPHSDRCTTCESDQVKLFGTGTQKVDEELRKMFPDLPILRMDQDTTRKPDAYPRMVRAFQNREYQILLGTQSVAKGHDFPGVTFVGVVNADTELAFPDFRAHERTFQLLTQVIGRAGRSQLAGRAVVQTYRPENPAIQWALKQDYDSFAAEELQMRRQLNYPPFSRIATLTILDEVVDRARELAERTTGFLRRQAGRVQILGPTPAPIQKIWKHYRFQVLLKSVREQDSDGDRLRQLLTKGRQEFEQLRKGEESRMVVNVDPLSIS